MYYEEKVIDGVLCWRNTPDGEWTQFKSDALTIALRAERVRSKKLEEDFEKLAKKMADIKRLCA